MKNTSVKLPETLDEIMLLQPNNITFGQYELSEVQENILTLIIDSIQDHVTNKKELPRDLFNQPYVEIICDEAKGKNSKTQVKEAIKGMFKKQFSFKWVHPDIHKTVETTGTIISTMHDIKGTNRVEVNFNIWAVPFFIYYGVGVGGTLFNKKIALSLRGDYTKRIYKIICRWQDKTHFEYNIEQFKKDLGISRSYDNNSIKTKILETAKDRIKESGSTVWFDFELICKYPKKGRKPKDDTIIFKIKNLTPQDAGGEQYEEYATVLRWMRLCYGDKSSKPFDVTEKLTELGALETVYKRIVYYQDQINNKEKEEKEAYNSLKVMLLEEYKISKE